MKNFLYSVLLALVILIGVGGCGDQSVKPAPSVVMRVLDPSLEQFAPMWQAEIARRFPNAVGILIHGGEFQPGIWIVEGNYASGNHVRTAQEVVREVQALFPNKTVVLCACNPGHIHLGIPGIYYAMDSVWTVPDRDTASVEPATVREQILFGQRAKAESRRPVLDLGRWASDPGVVGNVFEMVSE